jgi:uncharacterized protein YceH (UPF0502 family)
MVQLTPDECRVLGVLVEKAHTVASQYPMSLNAITTGCNQKSNRNPVVSFDEDRVIRALESLRDKGLVLFADTISSRVMKYRHHCREVLAVGTNELVVLTELMLRGPQTAGEIRTRASRMHALGSLEELRNLLQFMMDREEPLIRRIPPAPGSRAERFVQLLCPDLHLIEQAAGPALPAAATPQAPQAAPELAGRVERLEGEVARLRRVVEHLARALGETDALEGLSGGDRGEDGAQEDALS